MQTFSWEWTETHLHPSLHPSSPWLNKMSRSSLPLFLPAPLLGSLCHFARLLSPNMVNRTGPRHRCFGEGLCVAAEWLVNISLSSLDVAQPNPSSRLIRLPCDYNRKLERESRRAWSFLRVPLYNSLTTSKICSTPSGNSLDKWP